MKGKKLHFKLFTLLFLILGMAACHTPSRNQEMSSDINTIEDSLKNGKFEAAMQMINKHLSETNDSDIYYRWLSVKNIAWHSETNVDSMLSTSEQIHQYLLRNNQQNPIRQLLWAEWYKAQGVYFSAILGKQDSALAYTQKSLSVLDDTPGEDDLKLVARTNMAFFYRRLGQYDKSIESYMLGLELADSLGKIDEARTVLLLGISTAYTYMNDFTRSEYWWNRTSQLLPYMIKAFENKENTIIAKIGLTIDKEHWSNPDKPEKEHIWFEIKDIKDGSVVGELTQEPYYVSGMKQGDTGTYPFSDITDWLIFTKENRVSPDDAYLLD